MLKPWSITTTVRSPERLRDFLLALQPLVGKKWDLDSQEKYQKLLIRHRLYGYGSQQFYTGLPREIVNIFNKAEDEIDDDLVDKIVEIKKYREFAMRGRQSLNPLTKFGFVYIDNGILTITKLGQKLIASEKDSGDVFLKSFIKWQIPNPANDDYADNGDYKIVPFVGTLMLISQVNKLEAQRGNNPVGLHKSEFILFVPSLVRHKDIALYAQKILDLRDLKKGKTKEEQKEIYHTYAQDFAHNFLGTSEQQPVDKLLTNLRDYGDNTIRYFRLTKFIRIRGNGFCVDLEPNRSTEIESLLEAEFYLPRDFADKKSYLDYMSNDSLPHLPWQTKTKLSSIALGLYAEVNSLQNSLGLAVTVPLDISSMSEDELILEIDKLRTTRQSLQEKNNHLKAQPVESVAQFIDKLEKIYTCDNRPLMLEYLTTMGLHALNDAQQIKPNYPVGDDNEPTSTAPGGMADIECHYDDFNLICEVTMLNGRDQWYNEGQPVMRHLRDFEHHNSNAYCIFIAPTIHVDSAETFWLAGTYGYKGAKQKIAPITISQFITILKKLKFMREANQIFTHDKLHNLIQTIVASASTFASSDDWVANIESLVQVWIKEF
jgi:hypothetical protein